MTKVCIALNAGSSSLKFQIFEADAADERSVVFRGLFERLGGAAHFVVKGEDGRQLDESSWQESDSFGHEKALLHLVAWLQAHKGGRELAAVGHRIVHGGAFYDGPVTVDDRVIANLESLAPLAPLHQPYNLEPVRIVRRRLPHIPQIACFDTSFHATSRRWRPPSPCPAKFVSAASGDTVFMGFHTSTSLRFCKNTIPPWRGAAWLSRILAAAPACARWIMDEASQRPWAFPRSTGFRWEQDAAPSTPARFST